MTKTQSLFSVLRATITFLGLAFCVSQSAIASDQSKVRVLARADLFSIEMLGAFQRATGHQIELHVYDPATDQQTPLQLIAGESGYDLVILPSNLLATLIDADAVQRLDKPVEGTHQIGTDIQRFLVRYYVTREQQLRFYGIPLFWGTTGIGYGPGYHAVFGEDARPSSLATIFSPETAKKLSSCGIGVADAANEIVGAALAYLGRDPRSRTAEDLKAAEEALMAIRPYMKGVYGSDLGEKLKNKEICVALGWSGSILRASLQAKKDFPSVQIGFSNASEGSPAWIDLMAVPTDSSNIPAAYALMNYLLQAKVSAAISERIFYPSANSAANNLNWASKLFNDRRIYPTWKMLDTMFIAPAQAREEQEMLLALWDRVKKANN